MKRMNFRKAMGAAVLIGATIMAADAMAVQPQAAYGPGYGMTQKQIDAVLTK